jgi:hypothetical protein
MARPVLLTKTLQAASANNIAQSQSPGVGAITLNGSTVSGGVATLDTQRRILITSGGNDSGITFTVFGTNQAGASIQETVTGSNATSVFTNQDFLTVTSVTHTGSVASTVTVGTNSTGSTPWLLMDQHVTPACVALALIPNGDTVSAEYTYDDFLNLAAAAFPTVWSSSPGQLPAAMTGATTNKDATMTWPVKGVRLTVTAGTAAATMEVLQAGIKQ